MSQRVTGTFTGVATSDSISGTRLALDLTFVGSATIEVQWLVDGTNWRTIETYTSSVQKVIENVNAPVRLECTAHTDNVAYAIKQI